MAALPAFSIHRARSPADVTAAASLFRAYAEALGIDLTYQGFEAELAALPGKYAPPDGELLLARDASGEAVGCAALQPRGPPRCCELKRLYTAPAVRGRSLGRELLRVSITVARDLGHREMRLDTLPGMAKAIAMYEAVGFKPTQRYYDTPREETMFFALDLQAVDVGTSALARPAS